jgi:hypothetical protein
MAGRTTRISVTFSRAYALSDVDGVQPAGTYRVQTVDMTLDNPPHVAHHRISTTIELPAVGTTGSRRQVVVIDPLALEAALERDAGRQRQDETIAPHGTVETNLESGCEFRLR